MVFSSVMKASHLFLIPDIDVTAMLEKQFDAAGVILGGRSRRY